MTNREVERGHRDTAHDGQASGYMNRLKIFKDSLRRGARFERAGMRDKEIIVKKYRVAEIHTNLCTCECRTARGNYLESFTWPELFEIAGGKADEPVPSLTKEAP